MANQRTIKTNDLTAGTTVVIRGRVTYSHIASLVEGDALKKYNDDAIARNRSPMNRPFTRISICNAQVILPADRQQMNTEERYVVEHMYQSQSPDSPGNCYSADSKSPNLPGVAVINPETRQYDPVEKLDGELARGLDVTLIMQVFDAKPNKGFGLNSVLCNEPIRYFGRALTSTTMAAYGIQLSGELRSRPATPAPAANPYPENNGAPAGVQPPAPAANPYPENNGAPAGVQPPAPGANGYSTNGYAGQTNMYQAPNAYAGQQPPQPPQAPPAGYPPQPPQAPPADANMGYQAPPAGYQPPAGYPPQTADANTGYQAPPAGYPPQPPQAPPAQPAPADPAAGYPGPFTPGQAAGGPVPGYPAPDAGGVAYNPHEDPQRQY